MDAWWYNEDVADDVADDDGLLDGGGGSGGGGPNGYPWDAIGVELDVDGELELIVDLPFKSIWLCGYDNNVSIVKLSIC